MARKMFLEMQMETWHFMFPYVSCSQDEFQQVVLDSWRTKRKVKNVLSQIKQEQKYSCAEGIEKISEAS